MSTAFPTRRALFVVLPMALLLAGCPARVKPPSEPSTPPVAPVTPGEGIPYDIVPAESLLTIQVYRGGTLARAGHNHVIASHEVTGKVYVNDDIVRSSFQLQFPVATLTVDEPGLREQAGSEFPPEVPESAKEGTKRNMLGEALLNAAVFPTISLVSTGIAAGEGGLNAQVQVTVRDQTRTLAVPVRYEIKDGQLLATGELPLKQTDLGLKPFSVMMGALEVKDDMKIQFHIVATPHGLRPTANRVRDANPVHY